MSVFAEGTRAVNDNVKAKLVFAVGVLGLLAWGSRGPEARHDPGQPTADQDRASQGWQLSEGTSAMDDSKTVALSRTADGNLAGWLQATRPELVARCEENRTLVYLVTGVSLNPELGRYEEYTVRLRMDDGPARTQRWRGSTDDKAIFAPDPIPLLRQLAAADTLKVELTPFNASAQVITFRVAGLNEQLGVLAASCHWKV